MAHCPECGTEYGDGTAECDNCHAELEPGPPDDLESLGRREAKLVRLRVFSGPTSLLQANLAKNLLEAEGIPSVLPGAVMGEILPGVEVIQMFVHQNDAERAGEILQAFLENPQVESAE